MKCSGAGPGRRVTPVEGRPVEVLPLHPPEPLQASHEVGHLVHREGGAESVQHRRDAPEAPKVPRPHLDPNPIDRNDLLPPRGAEHQSQRPPQRAVVDLPPAVHQPQLVAKALDFQHTVQVHPVQLPPAGLPRPLAPLWKLVALVHLDLKLGRGQAWHENNRSPSRTRLVVLVYRSRDSALPGAYGPAPNEEVRGHECEKAEQKGPDAEDRRPPAPPAEPVFPPGCHAWCFSSRSLRPLDPSSFPKDQRHSRRKIARANKVARATPQLRVPAAGGRGRARVPPVPARPPGRASGRAKGERRGALGG